jgi:hypothetical protein
MRLDAEDEAEEQENAAAPDSPEAHQPTSPAPAAVEGNGARDDSLPPELTETVFGDDD